MKSYLEIIMKQVIIFFEEIKNDSKMSMIGEMEFFLVLHIVQKNDGEFFLGDRLVSWLSKKQDCIL